jgi:signal transduction histidine kinase
VRIRQTPAEIVFRVRDWGPGISDENLEKIFDGDFTTKPGHAGIGLALVRSIVHRARGRIDVERPSGGGLAMSAVFPA